MHTQIVDTRENDRPADWVETCGMLFWTISMLVIGLRLAIGVPAHPVLLGWLTQVVRLLAGAAIVLTLAGLLRLARALSRRQSASSPRATARSTWRAWLRRDWRVALAVDGLLAAGIIPVATTLAAQDRLDWRGAGWLAIIAAIRIVFEALRGRAAAGSVQIAPVRQHT